MVMKGFWRLILVSASMLALVTVAIFVDLNANEQAMPALALIAYPIVAVSCVTILLAVLGTRLRLARSAVLRYLGKISYGLYVYHMFAFWVTQKLISRYYPFLRSPIYAFIALVVTIGCASLSYRFLESPFLRLKGRYTYIPSRPI